MVSQIILPVYLLRNKVRAPSTQYTECQAFSPVVRTGSPPPAPLPQRVLPPPPKKKIVLRVYFSEIWSFSTKSIAEYPKFTLIKEKTEAECLNIIGTKESQSTLLKDFIPSPSTPPPPPRKSGLKLVCYVNILYGNVKSDNSQDYAHPHLPQRNCVFINSASEQLIT